MLILCKSTIMGAAFLAGVAIAANADPASTSAAGTDADPEHAGLRRAASAAGDEHGTAARRVAAGALSASSTLLRPGTGPSAKSPQRSPSGREVAAAWLLCVFIAVLALGATSGLH